MYRINIKSKLNFGNSNVLCSFFESCSKSKLFERNKVVLQFHSIGSRKLLSEVLNTCKIQKEGCSLLTSYHPSIICPGRHIGVIRLSSIHVSPNCQYSQLAEKAKHEKALLLAEEIRKEDEEFSILKRKLVCLGSHGGVFPLPKSHLHEAYVIISSQLEAKHSVEFTYQRVSETPVCWECSASVEWPSHARFTSRASSKGEAANRASLLALLWLQGQGKLNQNGAVERLVNSQEKVQSPNTEIKLSQHTLEEKELAVKTGDQEMYKFLESGIKENEPCFNDGQIDKSREDVQLYFDDGSHGGVFPLPKSHLHEAYVIFSSQLEAKHSVEFTYQRVSETPVCWECSASVEWPSHARFTSRASSKGEAANRASLLALLWLQGQGKLNQNGAVERLVNSQAKVQLPNTEIKLSEHTLEKIELAVNKYDQEILKILETDKKESEPSFNDGHVQKSSEDVEFYFDLDTESTLKGDYSMAPHEVEERNQDLLTRHKQNTNIRHLAFSSSLPIHFFREDLVRMTEEERVLVVEGEPGCGKSTQVPQYIFETFVSRGSATDCNVVVTQPRRISAITLAERVAFERNEQVGDVVGHHLRLNSKLPRYQNGYILFCSTGKLLQKMLRDPNLTGVSHVIVDEAHERSIQVDFLMLLLKRALQLNTELRVLIMSATINAQLFSQFFNDCASISIPGFTHPVKAHFLNEDMKSMLKSRGVKIDSEDSDTPKVNIQAVVNMINFIDEIKPAGAILVFLPGWFEIKSVVEEMAHLKNAEHFFVVPAHSKLSSKDQKRIFKIPFDKRKVILSTNIAETSLTINDVVYVIDCGAHKEERLDMKSGLVCLDSQWVSQANVLQRRGRAGRVQPGESYHLFTEDKFQALNKFPTPEIHRVPLTRTVLEFKVLRYSNVENISQFLSCLPEPPSTESVAQAIQVLLNIGALDQEENLTALGKRIYKLPLDPHLSKALVHACFFRCVEPMVTISTLLSADFPLFQDALGLKSEIRELKKELCDTSDHLALNQLVSEWQSRNCDYQGLAITYCEQKNIVLNNMEHINQLIKLHVEHLKYSKLIPLAENVKDSYAQRNTFSAHPELVKGLLLSGLGNVLTYQNLSTKQRGFTLRGNPAHLTSESVNFKATELTSPFLTYFRSKLLPDERVVLVQESSLLSPVSLVLFLPGTLALKAVSGLDSGKCVIAVPGTRSVNIAVNQKEGEQLLKLRQVVWKLFDFFVENEGELKNIEQYNIVSDYRDDLVSLLVNVLAERTSNHSHS